MKWAKLPTLRETLTNGAKGVNKYIRLKKKKQEEKFHSAMRCPSF